MKFRQRRTEQSILDRGQNPVPDILVKRHSSFQRASLYHHPRSEYHVSFARGEGTEQIRQAFRRVLAVAVEEGHEIESVLNRIMEPDLLIAAVALVLGVVKDTQRERQRPCPPGALTDI